MSTFTFPKSLEVSLLRPGTIMLLPPKDLVPKAAYTDPKLHIGAFNHPIVILSCPTPKLLTLDVKVKVAIVSLVHSLPLPY
jgi:hypothetical protein